MLSSWRCDARAVEMDGYEMEYVFKKFDGADERMLVCPSCREFIARPDIEHFHLCPYCGATLEMTDELEDFLLDPIVADWTLHERGRMM